MITINPIETHYAGCRFRSRLEARWAVFFNALGIRWEYEPQGYVIDGRPYLPDFKLLLPGDAITFAEVKGGEIDEFEGEHVELCRALAVGVGHPVLLLIGLPAHRTYHRFAPDLPPDVWQAAFFTDYAPMVFVVNAYWAQGLTINEQTGAGEFSSYTKRDLRKSFGQGLVDAVRAARSARFEHGEEPVR